MPIALVTHTVTHIAKTRTDYSGVIVGIEIPCTANMVEAIRKAKSEWASYLQLPNVMRPTNMVWEWDPRQIVEVIPVPKNDTVPWSYYCMWLQKHAPNEICKCFEGKKYDVSLCEKVLKDLYPSMRYHYRATPKEKFQFRTEVRRRSWELE
jgi:hypothetical protein